MHLFQNMVCCHKDKNAEEKSCDEKAHIGLPPILWISARNQPF